MYLTMDHIKECTPLATNPLLLTSMHWAEERISTYFSLILDLMFYNFLVKQNSIFVHIMIRKSDTALQLQCQSVLEQDTDPQIPLDAVYECMNF